MVGASSVNATSELFIVDVYQNEHRYHMECKEGIVTHHVSKEEKISKSKTGTTVKFILDKKIWPDSDVDIVKLKYRIKQIAYLNPKLVLYFKQDNEGEIKYSYPEGISAYLTDISKNTNPICNPIILTKIKEDIHVNLAFLYSSGYKQEIYTFVNNVATERAGDHMAGFKLGIGRTINKYIKDNSVKGMHDILSEDMLEGIIAIVAVRVKNPRFEGQGKTAIRMPELKTAVADCTEDIFYEYLSKNPKVAKEILNKISDAAKARLAAKRARQEVRNQKSTMSSITLPGKLKACSCRDPKKTELFLVEGDSAAGTAVLARDNKTQAILPVFGKILNADKTRFTTIMSSPKILEVVKALGCGIGESFDINKLRYHKIIIMADADYFRSII
jgi:DNA gyrase subunit B